MGNSNINTSSIIVTILNNKKVSGYISYNGKGTFFTEGNFIRKYSFYNLSFLPYNTACAAIDNQLNNK